MTAQASGPAISPRPEENVPPLLPRIISYNLRIGAGLSAALILLGLLLLAGDPASVYTMATIRGASFSLSNLGPGLLHGQGTSVLVLGFLVLIVTPLTRVIISVVSFAVVHDRAFTLLTVCVLVLLGATVFITTAI